MSNRIVRINELVQREISDILRQRHAVRGGRHHDLRGAGGAGPARWPRVRGHRRGRGDRADRFRWLQGGPRRSARSWRSASSSSSCRTSPTCSTSRADKAARVLQALDEIEHGCRRYRPPRPETAMGRFFPELSDGVPGLLGAVAGRSRRGDRPRQARRRLHRLAGGPGARARRPGLALGLREPGPGPAPPRVRCPGMTFIRHRRGAPASRGHARGLCRLRGPRAGGRAPQAAFPQPGGQHRPPPLEQRASPRSTSWTAARPPPCEILAGLFIDQGLPVDRQHRDGALTRASSPTPGQFRFNSTSQRTLRPGGRARRAWRLAAGGRLRAL